MSRPKQTRQSLRKPRISLPASIDQGWAMVIAAAIAFIGSVIGIFYVSRPQDPPLTTPPQFVSKDWNLLPGQTLYVAAGGFRYRDYTCGDDEEQLCVLLFTASQVQEVTLTNLPILANSDGSNQPLYYDAVLTTDPATILAQQADGFWKPNNCGDGCLRATILQVKDGRLTPPQNMNRP